MAIYSWACANEDCDYTCEVVRPMASYEQGPDDPCPKCCGNQFKRFIAEWKKEQTSLVHGGSAPWFSECWTGHNGRVKTGR